MARVLVVANQTVAGAELLQAIEQRMSEGPCEFTLLVPATARAHLSERQVGGPYPLPLPDATGPATTEDYDRARKRMEVGVGHLQGMGATADGDVGGSNPLNAIQDILSRRQYDEIILSTLPSGISRWLNQDLPSKVRRRFGLPVTTVTATPESMRG